MLLSAVLRPPAQLPSITCAQLKNHLETSLNLAIAVHDIVAINDATISCWSTTLTVNILLSTTKISNNTIYGFRLGQPVLCGASATMIHLTLLERLWSSIVAIGAQLVSTSLEDCLALPVSRLIYSHLILLYQTWARKHGSHACTQTYYYCDIFSIDNRSLFPVLPLPIGVKVLSYLKMSALQPNISPG